MRVRHAAHAQKNSMLVYRLSLGIHAITYRGFLVCALAYAALLFFSHYYALALYFVLSFGAVLGTVGALKLTTRVARPQSSLIAGMSTYAFPSGHAAVAAFTAVAVPLTAPASTPAVWAVFGAVASFVAYSRYYLRAHTALQVVAGALLGVSIPLAVAYGIVLFVGPLA